MAANRHLLGHWVEWETDGEGDSPKAVLVIETDLETVPGGVDSGAMDDLIDATLAIYKADLRFAVSKVRIVPKEKTRTSSGSD